MKNYFSGKKILIVGASQGIGKSIALKLSQFDCKLFVVSRNEIALIELCKQINSLAAKASYAVCDVSIKEDVNSCVQQAIEQMKTVDIAIINAGINGSEGFENFNSDVFKKIYNVNVYGILHCLEYLIPEMKKNNGGIIAGVSSLADIRGFPGSAAYSSSKAAASLILEAANLELSSFNIKVLTIKPGFVDTNMTKSNKFPMPFLITSEKAAKYIIKGLEKEKILITFPFITKFFSDLGKILPKRIFNIIFSKRNFKF